MGDGRWEMGDGRWEMGDGKTAKACSRFGHERKARWPVGPKARAARLSQHGRLSHTKARRHEGTKTRRRKMEDGRWKMGDGDFCFWLLLWECVSTLTDGVGSVTDGV
jgi:hypothetical protein